MQETAQQIVWILRKKVETNRKKHTELRSQISTPDFSTQRFNNQHQGKVVLIDKLCADSFIVMQELARILSTKMTLH